VCDGRGFTVWKQLPTGLVPREGGGDVVVGSKWLIGATTGVAATVKCGGGRGGKPNTGVGVELLLCFSFRCLFSSSLFRRGF
jgi:hypothetical protein